MESLYYVGQRYLGAQILIENGGVGKFILNHLDFENGTLITAKLENVRLWATYIKDVLFNTTRFKPVLQNQTYQLGNLTAVDNPNRLGSIMMIFWLVTFVLLVSALYINTERQHKKDEREKKKIKNFKFILARTRRRNMCRLRLKRISIIFSVSLTIVIWIAFMSLLCTSQYMISSKLTDHSGSPNNSGQQYSSINNAITLSFNYLNNFFHIITNKTGSFLDSNMATLGGNIKSQLNYSILGLGNEILVRFNITDLFTTAKILLKHLTQVISGMTFINDNCQGTLADIDNIKGSVAGFQRDIDVRLNRICDSVNNSQFLLNVCLKLKTTNLQFKSDINTSRVDPSSSKLVIYMLNEYHINITYITTTFYNVSRNLTNQLNQMLNSTVNRFDISSYLAIVSDIWNKIVSTLSPTINSTNTYQSIFNSALDSVSKYENLITIILILLIFIGILLVLLLSFRDSIQDKSLNQYVNFGIQFFFLLVLTLSSLFCSTVLIMSNFSKSEICNQINTTTGVTVLDQIVNDKISIPWQRNIAPLLTSYQNINITVSPPINIISGIKDRCRNTSIGLFSVMEMGHFVNVTKFVRSESIMNIVLKAKNDSLKAFLDAHPEKIIPRNINDFIEKTESLVIYFENIDYTVSIHELQKPLIGISDFAGFFNDLSTFVRNSSQSIGWTNDLLSLNNTANQLLTNVSTLTLTQRNVSKLADKFTILQNNRNNSRLLNRLKTTLTNIQSLFSDTAQIVSIFSSLYNDVITIKLLNTIDTIVSNTFDFIVRQMLPCNDLSLIYEALTTTVCASSNFNVSLAAFGLMLLMETITCQIISIVVMISTSLRLNFEENVSKC